MSKFYVLKSLTNGVAQRPGLSTHQRPDEVHQWIKRARKPRIKVKSPATYKTKFMLWWDHLNPSWRIREDGRLTQRGTGDWSPLVISGINGFVSVIAALAAYRDAATLEEWVAAATDVSWVLSQVLDTCRNGHHGATDARYVTIVIVFG